MKRTAKESTFNKQLREYIAHNFKPGFRMVRYVYLLENENRQFLLVRTEKDDFPATMFTHSWQILSDSYYASDMYDYDVLEGAQKSVEQFTNLTPGYIVLTHVAQGYHEFEHDLAQSGVLSADQGLQTIHGAYVSPFFLQPD